MVVGVSGHVTDAHRNAITHAYYAELGYRVLFEVLVNECRGVNEGQEVSSRPEIFLIHGKGDIEDEDEMADDASLEGCGVLEKSIESQSSSTTASSVQSYLTSSFCSPHAALRQHL